MSSSLSRQGQQADALVARGERHLKRKRPGYYEADSLFSRALRKVEGFEKEAAMHIRIAKIWEGVEKKTEFTKFSKANNLHQAALLTPASDSTKKFLFALSARAFAEIRDSSGVRNYLWDAGLAWKSAAHSTQGTEAGSYMERAKEMFLEHLRQAFRETGEIAILNHVIEHTADPVERAMYEMVADVLRPS
jgi:hypothetical protein